MKHKRNFPQAKISAEFAARLNRLDHQQRVRAIVLIHTKTTENSTGQRQSRAERQAAIKAMRKSTEQALSDIDEVLERFGGQRLARSPDALSTIPIETTAAGIKALATSKWIKAIIEDQEIHRIL